MSEAPFTMNVIGGNGCLTSESILRPLVGEIDERKEKVKRKSCDG